jgi:hypothetical protein
MTDEHKKLRAEYRALMKRFGAWSAEEEGSSSYHSRAIRHILKRLGPPTAEEAADIGIHDDAEDKSEET